MHARWSKRWALHQYEWAKNEGYPSEFGRNIWAEEVAEILYTHAHERWKIRGVAREQDQKGMEKMRAMGKIHELYDKQNHLPRRCRFLFSTQLQQWEQKTLTSITLAT